MATVILATKFFVPPPPPKAVLRPRLIERLNEGLHRKLTLISAPAGFGKTTLVSEWVTGGDRKVAWLSLDERDSKPVRFLTYLVAALRTFAPNIGEELVGALKSRQPLPFESILTTLLNEISTLQSNPSTGSGETLILVLDDYHWIDARPVDDALTFLIEHLPPQMHLVITTREDPAIPIPRLRARGQLVELRARDLRFNPSEAAEFLNQVMDLNLSTDEVAALETRTEGWIAGLQLAALSMQRQQDVTEFIRAFAGDHRYIVDYLVEEVLQRQPDSVRIFLLHTAVLDRLNGSLCDAVTGLPGGKAMLEALQRGNFFVISLDDRRHWYRYHHLFTDVLRMHLMAEQPGQIPILHRRASGWYEQNGLMAEAIRHALSAEDFNRAANLIEQAAPEIRRSRQDAMLLGWLQALPEELFQYRPVLSVVYAHVLLAGGELKGVETLLRDAERWLDTTGAVHPRPDVPAGAMIVVDHEEFRRLPGTIAIARAGLALARGDVSGTVTSAQRALDLALEEDHLTRGGAAGFLGLAFWTSGDLEAAHRMYAEGMANLRKAGNVADAINGSIALANIRITQGRLREAMSTYERGLQLATEQGGQVLRGTADMYVGMSELHYEHNDLEIATHLLLKSQELGEHAGFPQNRYRWRVAMARTRQAQGDPDAALDLLHEAEDLYRSDFSPNVHPVSALKARVWIAQGRLDKALGWADEQGLSAEDEISFLREFEHITLARLLLARTKKDHEDRFRLDAIDLLERLGNAAEEGGRTGSLIEILALQALAHQMQDSIPSALVPLSRALTLAEPEGYVRIFLDEGAAMVKLLREAATQGIMPEYTRKLLGEFRDEGQPGEIVPPISASQPPIVPEVQPEKDTLVEPLSQRELEILRLFKTELSGPEIARELVIALSTVRTHTKSIYSKLGVNSRRAAVKRAIELGLI